MNRARFKLFDAHFHIVDFRFPLVRNNGFLPQEFTCARYAERMQGYNLVGGAVVSASFQGYDQTYLVQALERLGPAFVGVTQLPATVSDQEIAQLDERGVRAVRFNFRRGGLECVRHLSNMARRVPKLAGWPIELYVDSEQLKELYKILVSLPSVSIDHLGLATKGVSTLIRLAERGVRVKATGFGCGDLDIKKVLRDRYAANPNAFMFGTDLPSTRAVRPYAEKDTAAVTAGAAHTDKRGDDRKR